jgi:phosphoribosylaminoimidazole-succinocarboxamide synthase
MPVMPDEFVNIVSERYIELYEKITGNAFERADINDIPARIKQNLEHYLSIS